MQKINLSSAYLEKQNAFVTLVKEVQFSLNSKEYKKQGYALNEFVKMKWNISQAQAYRYLICAKVLDQLEEFEIKPSYERLCRSLYNNAKTSSQMKLLWSTVLIKAGGRPDFINSTHISKIWKELSQNKQYDDICHFEDNIMNKVEKSLNKISKEKKHKQLNLNKSNYLNSLNSLNHSNSLNSLNSQVSNIPSSNIPSPTLSESSNLTSNLTSNEILRNESSLTPISNYSSISNDDDFQTSSISQIELMDSSSIPIFSTISLLPSNPSTSCIPSIPSTEPLYYLTSTNELMNKYEQPLIYIQEPSQQIIYYY